MNHFERTEDFNFAYKLAQAVDGEADIRQAHPSMSGWDENGIYICDRYGRVLLEFVSSEFSERMQGILGQRSNAATRFGSEPDTASLSRAVRTTRRFLRIVERLSIIASLALILTGLGASLWLVSNNKILEAILLPPLAFLAGMITYWSTRIANLTLELLSDVSEDLRLIRLAGVTLTPGIDPGES
jgi:hypothetical protein